ncbi:mediator of RNA polymerase II transcription subunit [Striga asiatica]|uniref:Mediator of RNA polymerase II transcription subunit n=1 Tax=Striga asiatica TaxID=4170 RepID=A0A5A7QM97_STRAF|nr:mediator of RNA polymerase II transcription subunit [Striga asiatica]
MANIDHPTTFSRLILCGGWSGTATGSFRRLKRMTTIISQTLALECEAIVRDFNGERRRSFRLAFGKIHSIRKGELDVEYQKFHYLFPHTVIIIYFLPFKALHMTNKMPLSPDMSCHCLVSAWLHDSTADEASRGVWFSEYDFGSSIYRRNGQESGKIY